MRNCKSVAWVMAMAAGAMFLTHPACAYAKPSAQPAQGRTETKPAEKKPEAAAPKINVGDMAPDFTLPDQGGKKVSLHDFRGKKNVALAFYIFAFTGG